MTIYNNIRDVVDGSERRRRKAERGRAAWGDAAVSVPKDSRHDDNGGRKQRSLSSPVRCGSRCGSVGAGAACARSPSASPSPPSPPQLHLTREVMATTDGGGAWRAYYSARPPPAPLALRAHPSPPGPGTDPADIAASTSNISLPQKERARQSHCQVTSILREMLSSLPPPAPLECPSPASPTLVARASLSSSGEQSEPVAVPIASTVSSESFRAWEVDVPCTIAEDAGSACWTVPAAGQRHVAVQALGVPGARVAGREWAGGVRALRDAHVRLVLRQLRHLRRLNAAVDRAAAAADADAAPQL